MAAATLGQFLLARMAEAEQAERRKTTNSKSIEYAISTLESAAADDEDDALRVCAILELQVNRQASMRVLEQCAAVRRIVAVATRVLAASPSREERKAFDFVLHELAAPFATHPDFHEEWGRKSMTAQMPDPHQTGAPAPAATSAGRGLPAVRPRPRSAPPARAAATTN